MKQFKGKTAKLVALLLAFAMVISMVMPGQAMAAEIAEQQSEVVDEPTTDQNQISDEATMAVQYVYVEKAMVTTPDEQNIVIGLGDEAVVESATLRMMKNDGTILEQQMKDSIDGIILFTPSFSDESTTGIYTIQSMTCVVNGVEATYSFADMGIADSKFGVNKECVTDPDDVIEEVLEEQSEVVPEVTVSVVDESGKIEASDATMEEVIEEVVETGDAKPMMASAAPTLASAAPLAETASTPAVAAVAPKVVVLDPGHGGKDGGAEGNGLVEKNLNLTIAKYCRDELSKYAGIAVYMTRETDVYVGLEDRVKKAAAWGADYFVSIHINSADSTAAKGAEVWYPNSNYKPEIGADGKALAAKVLEQLVALGLVNRGIQYRSTVNDKYPNGTVQDYYSVIRNSKLSGFPGIIIEHAFISNSSDATFMKSDANLKKLGIADATGIANYISASVTNWVKDGTGLKYKNDDGSFATNTWMTIGTDKYYFDANGYAAIGWKTIDGQKYYFDGAGKLVTGWKTISDVRYYFNPDKGGAMSTGWVLYKEKWFYFNTAGKKLTGLQTIDGKKYYIDSSTGRYTGWKTINTIRYYFDPNNNGAAAVGWFQYKGKTFYANADGKKLTGLQTIDGKKYYIDSSTGLFTGWKTINNIRYYFDPTNKGAAAVGWFQYNGKTFYANSVGKKLTGLQTIDGKKYYIDSVNGLFTGWKTINNIRYYFDPANKGAAAVGWLNYKDKLFYFNTAGGKVTGWVTVGTDKFYINSSSGVLKGWQTVRDKRYYFEPDTGKMHIGWLDYNTSRYYLKADGTKATGWLTIDGKRYYFDTYGRMATGWLTYKTKKFYMGTDGVKQVGWVELDGKKYYIDSSAGMVTGTKVIEEKTYYFDKNGVLSSSGLMTIMGTTALGDRTTAINKMVKMYTNSGRTYPSTALGKGGASTINAFCGIIYDEAVAEGVKPEVVFGQTMCETGYLQFGGDVKITQFNFAGIGATGGGVAGNSFPDVKTGIRAQVQHLKAYASKDALKNTCVDPRFSLVKRESAIYVEWLGIQENPYGGGWAASKNYGYELVKSYITPMYSL